MGSDDITRLLTQVGMRLDQQEQRLKEQEQRIQEQDQQIQELVAENERLKTLLKDKGASKGSKPPKFRENYSIDQHKGSRKSKRGRQSTGRRPHHSKLYSRRLIYGPS